MFSWCPSVAWRASSGSGRICAGSNHTSPGPRSRRQARTARILRLSCRPLPDCRSADNRHSRGTVRKRCWHSRDARDSCNRPTPRIRRTGESPSCSATANPDRPESERTCTRRICARCHRKPVHLLGNPPFGCLDTRRTDACFGRRPECWRGSASRCCTAHRRFLRRPRSSLDTPSRHPSYIGRTRVWSHRIRRCCRCIRHKAIRAPLGPRPSRLNAVGHRYRQSQPSSSIQYPR